MSRKLLSANPKTMFNERSHMKNKSTQPQFNLTEVHMLRTICIASLLVALLVIVSTGSVQAQINANVNASANVMSALSISATAMDFGNVPASRTAVLDPKNAANQYVGSTAAVGTVTITGANASHVLVTWPSSITLTDGTNNLSLTLSVSGDASNANQATSSALTSTADVVTSGSGNYSMWVGGSLPTGANSGLFAGSATFAVEYK
jgi:hypothetical protein